MPIITRIRTFLHMDKLTVNLDPDFVDSVGLYAGELQGPKYDPFPQGRHIDFDYGELHHNNFDGSHAFHHTPFGHS